MAGAYQVLHFEHTGWQDEQAASEMAMCGYTWAMIIDRLSERIRPATGATAAGILGAGANRRCGPCQRPS